MGTASSKSTGQSLANAVVLSTMQTMRDFFEPQKKFEYFSALPDALQKEVWGYLSLRDKSALASSFRRYKTLLNNDLMIAKCLMLVAHGAEVQADAMLKQRLELLSQRSDVTDYSGRTFKNITAYEYAYWAKDWHMCRMLASHMDEATKAHTLRCCERMDRDGLTYTQRGVEVIGSKHFDFTPLKDAYTEYLRVYDRWIADTATEAELDTAFFAVGIAQRDVPAYVAQEYCRPDRPFHPTPTFEEPTLPRTLTFRNWITGRDEHWYPLTITGTSGLGVDFTLIRGDGQRGGWMAWKGRGEWRDFAAVTSLDAASTVELARSRDNLKPLVHGLRGPGG